MSALLEEVLGHEAPDKSEEKKLDSGLSSMDDLEQLPRSWQRDPMDEFFMDVLDVSDEEIEKRMQSEIMPKAMNEYVRFEENNATAGNIDDSFEELIDSISTSESFHDTRWSDESKSSKFRTSRKTQSYHGESTPPPLFPTPLKLAASQSIDKWDQSKDKVFRRGPDSEIDEDKKRDRLRLGTIKFPHRAAVYNFFSTLLWETNFGYILNNEETEAFVDLIERYHPSPSTKLSEQGIEKIYVGRSIQNYGPNDRKSRCFVLVRGNGTEDDVSYRKLLRQMFPE